METNQLVGQLRSIMETRLWKRGPSFLNDYELPLAVIDQYAFWMHDAGYDGFFDECSQLSNETVLALKAIGATKSAELLQRAIPVYLPIPPESLPSDDGGRKKLISQHNGASTKEARQLWDEDRDVHEDVEQLLTKFALGHLTHIRLTADEATPAATIEGNWRQCSNCADAWEYPRENRIAFCPSCNKLTFLDPGTDLSY